MKIKDGFLFFWGNEDYMSNWHKASFELHGLTFNCTEQYMMYSKAMMFNDTYHADLIMKTNSQSKQKAYGRKVRNYDDAVWVENRIEVVYEGCLAKFEQNEELKKELLSTEDLHLVEASPFDTIWGIGMDDNNPDCTDPTKWIGDNLLGEVLMVVRESLKQANTVMKEYIIVREYSGYCRGNVTYKVLANSEKEAIENWYGGEEIENTIVRDDTETNDVWCSGEFKND